MSGSTANLQKRRTLFYTQAKEFFTEFLRTIEKEHGDTATDERKRDAENHDYSLRTACMSMKICATMIAASTTIRTQMMACSVGLPLSSKRAVRPRHLLQPSSQSTNVGRLYALAVRFVSVELVRSRQHSHIYWPGTNSNAGRGRGTCPAHSAGKNCLSCRPPPRTLLGSTCTILVVSASAFVMVSMYTVCSVFVCLRFSTQGVLRAQPFVKVGDTCPRALWSRRRWQKTNLKVEWGARIQRKAPEKKCLSCPSTFRLYVYI